MKRPVTISIEAELIDRIDALRGPYSSISRSKVVVRLVEAVLSRGPGAFDELQDLVFAVQRPREESA